MDNVVNLEEIKTLDQLKKELAAQQRETKAAMLTVQKLLKDISTKNDEIKHLQSLLNQTVPVMVASHENKSVGLIEISAEEEIAENQLERLRQTAAQRPLTLEETKIYDILVKNKRLTQDDSTLTLAKHGIRDVASSDLLQLAGKTDGSTKS